MAHGGYDKRRVAGRKPVSGNGRRSKALGVDKKAKLKPKPKPKPKSVSLKNQIRSVERLLRKDLPPEVREAQEQKLEGLKKQQEIHNRLAVERKVFLRDRKIKFFERRKIERRIRRLEKMQRSSSSQTQEAEIAEQLTKLKEDLEYVRFFPKTEKYVSLFMGGDDTEVVDRRNRLRKQIKSNIIAAAASGKDLEETGSEDDGLLDLSEDDFFLIGSSSDEADADDEWTDKSTREQASSASGKAASGMSSDERNQQRHISARALMPPPRPSTNSFSNLVHGKSMFGGSLSKKQSLRRVEMSTSSNTSNSMSESSIRNRGSSDSRIGQSSNLSSNSDARKPRRKRRPKKKKQQA
ncbi:rRNA-processing protein EFG1 isoform X1 [Diospyros lotus]|uniref:rRNA-processing protein EFG1 isoform X1 n=1 Tax=Diospyros lotus TaxID=55363 RepID=UPI00225BE823|nr:rRNA-processing protein EFG1 isoform X1 [Diospyros lotus]